MWLPPSLPPYGRTPPRNPSSCRGRKRGAPKHHRFATTPSLLICYLVATPRPPCPAPSIPTHISLAQQLPPPVLCFFWCLLFCSDRILYPRPGYTQSPALIVQRLVQVPLSVFQPPPPPLPHSPPHQAQRPKQRNSRRPFQLPTTSVQTNLIILFPSLAASTRIY